MTAKILYILVPGTHISPFDVTIAADAGFSQILPFTGVEPDQVIPLVQDAIFCRPPKRFNDTGIFIGGRDIHLATDMFLNAKKAMVDDFQVGIFADPNGAYTTSASVVALIERALEKRTGNGLEGRTVAVFGTGPVGLCTAVLAAQQGANAKLCQLTADDDQNVAKRFCERYKVQTQWVNATTHQDKVAAVESADVVVCAAKAGIRILETKDFHNAKNLLVAADVNAVPPSGVEGIGALDHNKVIDTGYRSFSGIGSLAIGNLKYKVQYGLFEQMQQSSEAALLDFPQAYEYAMSLVHDPIVEDKEKQAA